MLILFFNIDLCPQMKEEVGHDFFSSI